MRQIFATFRLSTVPPGELSLGRLAWRRLLRDPWAVGCAGLLLDAETQRPWDRFLQPGERSVLRPVRVELSVGALPLPPLPAGVQRLELLERSLEQLQTWRIVLRQGRMAWLQSFPGGPLLPELHLPAGTWRRLDGAGQPVPLTTDSAALLLRDDAPPPAGLFPDGTRVLLLQQGALTDHRVTALLGADGRVQSLQRDGQEQPRLVLDAPQIAGLSHDGVPQTWRPLLGSDHLGRDVLARVLAGGRISLLIGCVATLVSLLVGVTYGLISGWCGGRVDRLMMAAVDVLYALPFLFVVILLMVLVGRHVLVLFAALGAVQWLTTARIVRGQVLSLRHREFVEAAILGGASTTRILLRHLLPNCLGPIVVYTALTVPLVILQESFLAFIGLQATWGDGTLDSWGTLVNQGMDQLDPSSGARWWLLAVPASAMTITLLALNVLGDAIRDALDPRSRP